MSIQNLSSFVEYDEYLNPVYGMAAVKVRAGLRFSLKIGDIPYYNRGIDEKWLFKLGRLPLSEIRKLLADIDPQVTLSNDMGRVVFSDANLTIDSTAAGVQAMQTGVFL